MKINDETKVYFTSPASTGKNTESHPAQNGAPPPLKTILVPVEDLSQTAKKASCYAIPFARQMNARIILLHILPVTDAPAWRYDGVNHEWFFDIRGQRLGTQTGRLCAQGLSAGCPGGCRSAVRRTNEKNREHGQ